MSKLGDKQASECGLTECKGREMCIGCSRRKSVDAARAGQGTPFEVWWEREGQFTRAGGGQYEKSFAWHAWLAATLRAIDRVATELSPQEPQR